LLLFNLFKVYEYTVKMTLFLIDEPLESDHRVIKALERINNPEVISCLDVKHTSNKFLILITAYIFLKAFIKAFFYWLYLYRNYSLLPKLFFQGLKTSIITNYNALKIFKALKEKYKDENIETVYANDLMCGTIGFHLAKCFKVNLIYDAHEVEFHRNRKNGFFRVSFDMCVEREIVNYASSIIVVNFPILNLYSKIYNILDEKLKVINNNHFQPHINYALEQYNETNKEISILYIGGGINGRKLEKLTEDNISVKVNLNGFFLSNIPVKALENGWILGSKEYLPEVRELIKNKRCIMWACVDDICLSYRLSLPNKFFQAIALGIPIIANKGTYLEEIVTQYNLGYIYDDNNLQNIVDDMKINKNYEKLLVSVSKFQNKLFIEKLEL